MTSTAAVKYAGRFNISICHPRRYQYTSCKFGCVTHMPCLTAMPAHGLHYKAMLLRAQLCQSRASSITSQQQDDPSQRSAVRGPEAQTQPIQLQLQTTPVTSPCDECQHLHDPGVGNMLKHCHSEQTIRRTPHRGCIQHMTAMS